MATFDYAASKADADELIAEFGQSATLSRPTFTGPAYNPTPGTPISYAVTVVVLDFEAREVDGTRILAADRKVIMAKAGLATDPRTSDKLILGGVEHAIINVSPLAPGGTVLLYQLQARR